MILVRHPKTSAPAGMCYGRLDVGLSSGADAQIKVARGTVPKSQSVLSSPATRCKRLAEALAERDRVELAYDDRLMELDFGTWEGQMWQNLPRTETDPWAKDPWNLAPPDGESFAAMHARVAEVFSDLDQDANVTLVTHAGVVRAAQMILLSQSFDQVFSAQVPYAEPIRMQRQAA